MQTIARLTVIVSALACGLAFSTPVLFAQQAATDDKAQAAKLANHLF